jgi:hypothetical protein
MTKNLIPESRPDRNGKLVTRWVRPEDASEKKAKRIPSADSAVRKAKVQNALDAIFPDPRMIGNEAAVKRTLSDFQKIMPDVLERIVEAVQQDDDVAENLRIMIEGESLNSASAFPRMTFERALYIYPYTKKMMELLHPGTDPDWTRDVMFRMEKIIQDMAVVSITKGNVGKAAIMTSIFYDMHEDYTADPRELWLRQEDDIRYIANNLEAVEGIAPELMKRKAFDRATIAELLSAPSKSLTSGVL